MISGLYRRLILLSGLIIAILSACTDSSDSYNKTVPLRLSTTTSTVGSGLMDVLLPAFENKHSIKVIINATVTGKAIDMARQGKVDVILVHARKMEDEFLMQGYGVNRKDVMYNDFVLLGPADDPLNIKNRDILDALTSISRHNGRFFSRADNSGTHVRELSLWRLLGIQPQGEDWYKEVGKGMLGTLRIASEIGGYVITDRSTYLHNKDELKLQIMIEHDQRLFNPYGVIAVNPAKIEGVNFNAAMKFIDFVTSREGQEIIGNYGKVKFGSPLFTPMVIKH